MLCHRGLVQRLQEKLDDAQQELIRTQQAIHEATRNMEFGQLQVLVEKASRLTEGRLTAMRQLDSYKIIIQREEDAQLAMMLPPPAAATVEESFFPGTDRSHFASHFLTETALPICICADVLSVLQLLLLSSSQSQKSAAWKGLCCLLWRHAGSRHLRRVDRQPHLARRGCCAPSAELSSLAARRAGVCRGNPRNGPHHSGVGVSAPRTMRLICLLFVDAARRD